MNNEEDILKKKLLKYLNNKKLIYFQGVINIKKLMIIIVFNLMFSILNYKFDLIDFIPLVMFTNRIQKTYLPDNIFSHINEFSRINLLISRKMIYEQDYDIGRYRYLGIRPQVQQTTFWCSPATSSMLLSSYGIDHTQSRLSVLMDTKLPFGTHNQNAIKVINNILSLYNIPKKYNLVTVKKDDKLDYDKFKDDFYMAINRGNPVYLTLDLTKISDTRKGEHNVLGIGYVLDKKNDKIKYVIIYDPSTVVVNSTYGSLRIMSVNTLLDSLSMCIEPNYAY